MHALPLNNKSILFFLNIKAILQLQEKKWVNQVQSQAKKSG